MKRAVKKWCNHIKKLLVFAIISQFFLYITLQVFLSKPRANHVIEFHKIEGNSKRSNITILTKLTSDASEIKVSLLYLIKPQFLGNNRISRTSFYYTAALIKKIDFAQRASSV